MDARFQLFDAHFHIIDERFPLVPNHGYLPDAFSVSDYLKRMETYHLCGGAVVSGSFQAFDQAYLIDALSHLGPSFAGVTQLPADVPDNEISRLADAGVRALRFNLKRGGSEEVSELDSMARRVYEVAGWHVELYVDSRELAPMYKTLISLPAVSIDHLGLSMSGMDTLLRLAGNGVRVKATGFGRVDFNVPSALRNLCRANPESLMFGTDLPSTRAPKPYDDRDFMLIIDTLGEEQAKRVFYQNAAVLYKMDLKESSKYPGDG